MQAGDPPLISVVVATRDRPGGLAHALQSILANAGPAFEVIIVDQGEEQSACGVVAGFDDARVLYLRQFAAGKARALNLAMHHARGAIFVTTDDDCLPPPGWLTQVAALFDAHPEAAIAWGQLVAIPHDAREVFIPEFRIRRARRLRHAGWQAHFAGIGGNLAVRTHVLRELGGFDEALGPGSRYHNAEDSDLAYRTLRAGHPGWLDPENVVLHAGARPYSDGSGRRIINTSYFALGAMYGRHLRRGDPVALVGLTHEALLIARHLAVAPFRGQRPHGVRRLPSLLQGVVQGFRELPRVPARNPAAQSIDLAAALDRVQRGGTPGRGRTPAA